VSVQLSNRSCVLTHLVAEACAHPVCSEVCFHACREVADVIDKKTSGLADVSLEEWLQDFPRAARAVSGPQDSLVSTRMLLGRGACRGTTGAGSSPRAMPQPQLLLFQLLSWHSATGEQLPPLAVAWPTCMCLSQLVKGGKLRYNPIKLSPEAGPVYVFHFSVAGDQNTTR